MGVSLSKLIENKKEFNIENIKNKTLGVDAYNIIYQFISSIRSEDGSHLTNNNGDVTSHLSGIFYRLLKLKYHSPKEIIFVFDGISDDLKKQTIDKRNKIKEIAKEKLDQAIKDENIEDMKKYSMQTTRITPEIINSSKKLLQAMGVSYIDAPSEAEAQISYLNKIKKIDYTVSQDYDTLLFGSRNLVKNLTISGKKKIPFKNIYTDMKPEIIITKDLLEELKINNDKLIWLSILIGTDFNKKIQGIGPKTAYKLVKEYDSFEDIINHLKEKGKDIDFDYKEIINIFKNPRVDKDPKIIRSKFDIEKIKEILIDYANFSENRIIPSLDKYLNYINEKDKQKTLDKWF